MGLFDWLHGSGTSPETESGISRRAFFARVAGAGEAQPQEAPRQQERPELLCSFYVSRFPYHDGPVLVPILRTGLDLMLVPDPLHATDPSAVKILWGKDHLGYVPPEHSPDVRARLEARERLFCRSVSVDPGADLSRVLWVEITRELAAEQERDEGEEKGARS